MKLVDEIATESLMGDDGTPGKPAQVHNLGFDGRGVTVSVADSGLDTGEAETMHLDLNGRV
ncbi:MAG: alkaline serine protease, partial [Pedosphaera sp.]|nr:alkaline serine protease [Pedosphaera sp.]